MSKDGSSDYDSTLNSPIVFSREMTQLDTFEWKDFLFSNGRNGAQLFHIASKGICPGWACVPILEAEKSLDFFDVE